MVSISSEPLKRRDVFYYRRRFINRVHAGLAKFFERNAHDRGATKRMLASRLGVDPAQITRWLAHPTNLTLESISDILLALDAEAEPLNIVPFNERRPPNYMHYLLERALGSNAHSNPRMKVFTSADGDAAPAERTVPTISNGVKILKNTTDAVQ